MTVRKQQVKQFVVRCDFLTNFQWHKEDTFDLGGLSKSCMCKQTAARGNLKAEGIPP